MKIFRNITLIMSLLWLCLSEMPLDALAFGLVCFGMLLIPAILIKTFVIYSIYDKAISKKDSLVTFCKSSLLSWAIVIPISWFIMSFVLFLLRRGGAFEYFAWIYHDFQILSWNKIKSNMLGVEDYGTFLLCLFYIWFYISACIDNYLIKKYIKNSQYIFDILFATNIFLYVLLGFYSSSMSIEKLGVEPLIFLWQESIFNNWHNINWIN